MSGHQEIKIYGDPILRKKAEPFREISDEIRDLVPEFVKTMQDEDGVGLAANQIGIARRMIAVSDGNQVYVIFNPKIVSWSIRTIAAEEGCLSLPGLYAEVERSAKVVVKGLQEDGSEIELVARGIFARALQHEIDHLDGILFIDRMKPGTLKKLMKIEGQEDGEYVSLDVSQVKELFADIYHKGRPVLKFDREVGADTASPGDSFTSEEDEGVMKIGKEG